MYDATPKQIAKFERESGRNMLIKTPVILPANGHERFKHLCFNQCECIMLASTIR